jgi:SDR family mycofactocin-dependent oxidoreductase
MTERLAGKVALVTGAARGQGRSHALRLAGEGADLILCDLAEAGLEEVREEVERLGRRAVTGQVDIRSVEGMDDLVDRGVGELGRLDIAVANAAIFDTEGFSWELKEEAWREMIDVNLTGTWNTTRAVIPGMIDRDEGGSIVVIGAGGSAIGFRSLSHYNASKHGVVGLMRTLANELAPHRIRVNCISPSIVDTPMTMNERIYSQYAGGMKGATLEDVKPAFYAQNVLPVPWIEADDVSNALLFLVSDDGTYITGVDLPVDCGSRIQPPGLPPSILAD